MLFNTRTRAAALTGVIIWTLSACGGGGGGKSATTTTTVDTLTGTAATGAAFEGGTITVTDSKGTTVGSTSTIGSNGSFSITLSAGGVAPFILTATRTNADGASESLVSVVPTSTSSSATATVNISQVTTLIASRLSKSGNPAELANEVAAGTATVNSTTVDDKTKEVQTILAPVLEAAGVTDVNPLTGSFTTDGTGYDRLLDSVKVSITPDSATSTSIEVGLKIKQADGDAPVTRQFSSTDTTVPAIASNNFTAADMLPSGTSALIKQHLDQLNTCFALPTASRVSIPNPSDTTAIASASEANVTAKACRDAFIQTGGVIQFKSNGSVIGAKASSAFKGLFYDAGTGVKFSQGAYEFTRNNPPYNDVVVSYKKTDASGAISYDTFALRSEGGVLKQIGNQYQYGGNVTAYHQIRKFPHLNQSASDYLSTGYSISIPYVTGISHVAVTTPRGNTLVLKQQVGYENLQLVKNWTDSANPTGGTTTGSAFVRVRSEYVDQTKTTSPSATSDGDKLFFAATPFTNAEIAQIPAQGVWTIKYYLTVPNSPPTLAATQYFKTRARAMTIPELRKQAWAELTKPQLDTLRDAAAADGEVEITDSRSSLALDYTVPTGAMPPTSLQIWGKYTSNEATKSFSDTRAVASTARSGNVTCTNVPNTSDAHCVSGGFANPTRINGIHLWSRDTGGREFANFYALYQL